MSLDAGRVGVRADQVDVHGRVTSPSFLNELLDDLPEWTDMPVWVNGTEELLPSDNSVPVTSPILADIAYPDIRRDNQYFTYRESPTPVDGLAKIKSIKGNTLVWNQLVPTNAWTTSTNNGITWTNNGDGSYTVSGTSTGASFPTRNIEFKPTLNHKYLVTGCLENSGIRLTFNGASWFTDTTGIFEYTDALPNPYLIMYIPSTGITVDTIVRPQIFDLTQMGLYISSPSEFTSLFPLSYYSYNQGSLLSFNGNGIKTVGFNQWDEEWEVGWLSTDGVPTQDYGDRIRSKNYVKVLPNTQYYFKTPAGTARRVCYYDGAYGFISYADFVLVGTTPSNASYMKFVCAETTTYNNDICINISDPSKNGTYEPYTSSTLSLPISTYFPTGMKSAGDVYDELTPRKAITRIGRVDLGSLNWYQLSARTDGFFTNAINPIAKTSTTNLKLIGYTVDNAEASSMADMTTKIDQSDGTYLYIINSAYTSNPSGLKASLDGVYLYYELATPVELPTLSLGD